MTFLRIAIDNKEEAERRRKEDDIAQESQGGDLLPSGL
jgi:hypothetical protein